jgi:predicted lipid-binding transport protein (Tim44 family)
MGHTGGGIGLLDIIILCLIGYFAWRFFKKRSQYGREVSSYDGESPVRMDGDYGTSRSDSPYYGGGPSGSVDSDLQSGFDQIRRYDPNFNEESFKEVVQDIFFRIQAAWMNRDLNGVMDLLAPEMAENFSNEFGAMKQKGIINKLENIAVRKVEPTEAWQEMGKEYVTVLFTANLLDYTVDDKSNQVLEGDRLNPVKFQEFWTFCRDIGTQRWQLCAINQVTQ